MTTMSLNRDEAWGMLSEIQIATLQMVLGSSCF